MTLLISITFNQALIFCINTHASVLINQYSTGLFVSYSTHRKTQLHETCYDGLLRKKGGKCLY
jgi:hypothetical protein